MNRSVGLLLVAVGGLIVVVGLVVWAGGFSWFGRLPGDFHIETENTRISIPFVSMLLVSAVLTVVVNVLGRWW